MLLENEISAWKDWKRTAFRQVCNLWTEQERD